MYFCLHPADPSLSRTRSTRLRNHPTRLRAQPVAQCTRMDLLHRRVTCLCGSRGILRFTGRYAPRHDAATDESVSRSRGARSATDVQCNTHARAELATGLGCAASPGSRPVWPLVRRL